jgi:predicted GTPase
MSSDISSQRMMTVDFAVHLLRPASTARSPLISKTPLQHTRNAVICGEPGVGKSSIVNMLADQEVFEVSRNAMGTTLKNQGCAIQFGDSDMIMNVWDTASLNQSEQGQASEALQQFLNLLDTFGGVNLLVFVMRFRITQNTVNYYCLMRDVLWRERVPIIVAITNREFQRDNEKWWQEIKKDFSRYKMNFSGHAIGTANQHLASDGTYAELRNGLWNAIRKCGFYLTPGECRDAGDSSMRPPSLRDSGIFFQ